MGRRNPPLQIKWSINAQNEDVPNGPSERVFFLYPFGRKEECYHPAPGGMGGDRGHGQFKGRWGHLLQGSWSNCSPRLHLTPLSTQRFHVWENSPPKPWHKSEGGFGETSAQLCLNRQKTSDSLMQSIPGRHLALRVSGIALASSHFHDVVLRVRKQAIETCVS